MVGFDLKICGFEFSIIQLSFPNLVIVNVGLEFRFAKTMICFQLCF